MGGSAKTITRVATGIATGGLSEAARITSKTGKVGNLIGTVANPFGTAANLVSRQFSGESGYTPSLLPNTDPTMQLAQSGGASLLTSIALGANVDDAVAGYFGRAKGQDFDAWLNGLNPDQQAAVQGVRNQLTQIQQNTELRNQAVQKIVNDFPNVVSMTAPKVVEAKKAAGEEFDAATKSYLDYANNAIAAKFGPTGTVSSGAAIAAANRAASELGLEKLQYQTQEGNKALDLLGQRWQQQYTEANALRGFQQKMLGQGAQQGFSAAQAELERRQRTNEFNTNAANQQQYTEQQGQNALLGSIGNIAGIGAGIALAGPIGGAVGRKVSQSSGGAQDYGFSGPATPGYQRNNNPSDYGIGGGYR